MTEAFGRMLVDAKRAPGIEGLALLAALCASYARESQAEIDRRLLGMGQGQPTLPPTLPTEDRWLTPKEAAPLLGTSVQSLNRRWRQLPFCRPGVTRGFRVSLAGLRKYMQEPLPRKPTGRYAGPSGGER
jgi:hypothetical protein